VENGEAEGCREEEGYGECVYDNGYNKDRPMCY